MSNSVFLSGMIERARQPHPDESGGQAVRKVFVHTFGCQMNEADSQRMIELLGRHGYLTTPHPEEADLILLNTCSVREKAEQKLLSALGRYRELKARCGVLLAVGGCVAQQEKERLLTRVPYLDFIFGPDHIAQLPKMVARAARRERFAETGWMDSEEYLFPRADPEAVRDRATAFVVAMKGCDNVCSFCVVPRTRGREVSRPHAEIVAECTALAGAGVREVTLIGQNVNSYAGGCDFPALLRRVAAVPGIDRIRFTTSHPHDLSPALVEVFRDEFKVMPHFHLPVQSGSNRLLARMRRSYTVEEYLERHAQLTAARPGIAITTDFIVGFPGETDEDFESSMQLLERVRFENSFSFVFSPRPNTRAALRLNRSPEWAEVSRESAIARLTRLQARQREIAVARLQQELGREVEVLLEGRAQEGSSSWFGRTPENRVVHTQAKGVSVGSMVRVRVTRTGQSSLSGVVDSGPAAK